MSGVRGSKRLDTRARMVTQPWRPGGGLLTTRDILEHGQATREALYEAVWGEGWPAPLPVPTTPPLPPFHKIATDRCEQQQSDGSWQVATRDVCAVCWERTRGEREQQAKTARLERERADAERARADAERARHRQQQAFAERMHRLTSQPARIAGSGGPCPHCAVSLTVPAGLAPGEYGGHCYQCRGVVWFEVAS